MEGTVYKVWAAIGPLIGVLVGAWLTARWQRKRWIQDNKRAEYREVLDALQKYRWHLLNDLAVAAGPLVAEDARSYDERRAALTEAEVSLSNCLADRLFIRKKLARNQRKGGFGKIPSEFEQERSKVNLPLHRGSYGLSRAHFGTGGRRPWCEIARPF
jgi:uncharacterized membrane-anchored protein YhcB (DUF1043 family)